MSQSFCCSWYAIHRSARVIRARSPSLSSPFRAAECRRSPPCGRGQGTGARYFPRSNRARTCGRRRAEAESAFMQACARSSSKTPIGLLPTTSFGPVTGKAATGTPLASASSCTMPKVSVRLGKTNTSAEARCAASVPFSSGPRNFASGKLCLSFASCGPEPMTTLVPGRSSERKRFEIFLHGDPANGHEDRAGKVEIDGAVGTEEIDIHPAGPHAEIGKSALRSVRPSAKGSPPSSRSRRSETIATPA